jgi:hypothetical protein
VDGEVQLLEVDQTAGPLEFVKPLGTGINLWPSTPSNYSYTTPCTNLDQLLQWWEQTENLNAFAHVSHTFTHEIEDNATYFDVYREITWNQAVGLLQFPDKNFLSFRDHPHAQYFQS